MKTAVDPMMKPNCSLAGDHKMMILPDNDAIKRQQTIGGSRCTQQFKWKI